MNSKLPRGISNCNPGNIDRHAGVSWQGQSNDQSGDSRFVVFKTPEYGIRALAKVLLTYSHNRRASDGTKIDTLTDIVERWAPTNENDTDAYIDHLVKLTGFDADKHINLDDFSTIKKVVKAIITHENGSQPYSDDVINAGIELAGVKKNV